MQANRSRDTQPELAVRRILHACGLRYRVATAPLPGLRRRADIVFTRQHIAVFIDGCFWHGCEAHGRKSFQHNTDYWPKKIANNMERDLDTTKRLEAAGWHVMRFWEHESPMEVAAVIEGAVKERQASNALKDDEARRRKKSYDSEGG
jgi:DNA mismatch endonuclease (patch repair protein)